MARSAYSHESRIKKLEGNVSKLTVAIMALKQQVSKLKPTKEIRSIGFLEHRKLESPQSPEDEDEDFERKKIL